MVESDKKRDETPKTSKDETPNTSKKEKLPGGQTRPDKPETEDQDLDEALENTFPASDPLPPPTRIGD